MSLFLALLLLSGSTFALKPEYNIDRTRDLFGLVVYIEYSYYPEEWIVPWNFGLPHYTGCINTVSEANVFDPKERAQMKIIDCGNGFACIESTYDNYYLGLASLDYSVNFYEETTDTPVHEAYKFKFYCDSIDPMDLNKCNMVVSAYGDTWQLYATSLEYLKYCSDCGSYDWFRWRVKVVKPSDTKENEQMTQCNTGSNDLSKVLSHHIGVVQDTGTWALSNVVYDEVEGGMKYAAKYDLLTYSFNWQYQVSNSSYGFEQTITDPFATIIPPGYKVQTRQLVGIYGPYKVYTNFVEQVLVRCSKETTN